MNQRIQELAEQAAQETAAEPNETNLEVECGDVKYSVPANFIDKLTELVVKECIGVVEGGRFLHEDAPTARFAKECSGGIKRHFGITQ